MLLPARLKSGDSIGIFSPSSPISPVAVDKMTEYFRLRGYSVKVAPHTLVVDGFMAGTPLQRASDLNGLLNDPQVRLVMTSMGGAGAVHLVPLVDYEALARDPKFVVGLSDPSILLNAITRLSDVPTVHGPNGVEFGGLVPLTQFCEDNFWPIVAAELDLPYAFPVKDNFKVLRGSGSVEGRLVGGNLGTLQFLLGTHWEPDWKDAILFIEELTVRITRTDGMLAHFHLAGVFDQIGGLIVGKPVEYETGDEQELERALLRNCAGYAFPIVTDVLVGHTDDKISLPIGCRARLDASNQSLELLESPTC